MATLQTIEEEINQLEYLQRLLNAYESIAALYMRRTKGSVVNSRTFYEGLRTIYEEVLHAHRQEVEKIVRKRPLRRRLFQVFSGTHQQREAAVLLSVNTGLYGAIVQRTLTAFRTHILSAKTDVIIMGKRGAVLFNELMPKTPYTYIEFPDSAIDVEKVFAAAKLLSAYQHVRVFYGKFESFISQIPAHTVLGSYQEASYQHIAQQQTGLPAVLYLFEPSLEEVARFFETQIFTSLFQQLVEESHLGKLASRMYLLDSATGRIRDIVHTMNFQRQRFIHQLQNKKQQEIVHSRIAIGV